MGGFADVGKLIKIYWSLLLGNVVEWYEFAIYGYLAKYLESNLFHNSPVATWLGFAVTFLARPFGGLVLGFTSDVLGRNTAVKISIIGMMVGTCGQGLLPTFASGQTAGVIGLILLIFFRLMQGISAAGEICTISTYITEVSPARSLGRATATIAITAYLGFLLAKFVVFALTTSLGAEMMTSWGWRLPFLLAIVPGLVAVWGRRGLPEPTELPEKKVQLRTDTRAHGAQGVSARSADEEDPSAASTGLPEVADDQESRESESETASAQGVGARTDAEGQPSTGPRVMPEHVQEQESRETGTTTCTTASKPWHPRLSEVLPKHACNVAIGVLTAASFGISNYAGFVWMQSFLQAAGLSPASCMVVELCSRAVMLLAAYPAGWLADVQGVGWSSLVTGILITLGGLPIFAIIAAHSTTLAVVAPAMALLAFFNTLGGGTLYFLFVAELFPTCVRGTLMGVTYNVGVSLFGGLAPVLAEASLDLHPLGPGILLSLGGLWTTVTIIIALFLQFTGRTQLAHVRPQPYCRPFDHVQEEAGACSSMDADACP